MGIATSVQACATRYQSLGEVNCTVESVPYGNFGSNPSITGIGTDISFVLTAGLSLITCFIVQVWCDRLRHHSYRKLLEPLVVSFGDQQLLRGLSLSIATLFSSSACTIDAYRYNVLAYLLMMAIVSHVSSVLVLRTYTQGQIVLSCVRFLLLLAQGVFVGYIYSSRVSDTFPTSLPSQGHNTTMVLPAVCFENPNSTPYAALKGAAHTTQYTDGTALLMYIMLFVFYIINVTINIAHVLTYTAWPSKSWQILHKIEEGAKVGSWFWWMGAIRGLILLGANVMFAWALVRMYQLKHWFLESEWLSPASLQADNNWTFGQLLSVFILAGAPLAVLGAWSDFLTEREAEKARLEKDDLLVESTIDVTLDVVNEVLSTENSNTNRSSSRGNELSSENAFSSYSTHSPVQSPPQAGLSSPSSNRYTAQAEDNYRRFSGYSGHSRSDGRPPSYMDDIEMDDQEPFLTSRPTGSSRPGMASVPSYRAN